MKAILGKKKKAAAVVRRKPFDKVEEKTKIKIVEEIKTGMISCLGGHCKSCIDVIESTGSWEIKGNLDKDFINGHMLLTYPVIGTDDDIDELIIAGNYFFITVGQIKSTVIRKRLFETLRAKNAKIATIISPKALISTYATVGCGTIIHNKCIVNTGAAIGENNIINSAANIEHDCLVGNNNHISTGAVLNGNVTVGNECFIGSGSIVLNGISITHNVVLGAGSLVIENIARPGVYVGSPMRPIRN